MRAQIRGVGGVGADTLTTLEFRQLRSPRYDRPFPKTVQIELQHVRVIRPEPVPADEVDDLPPRRTRLRELGISKTVEALEGDLASAILRGMTVASTALQARHALEFSSIRSERAA